MARSDGFSGQVRYDGVREVTRAIAAVDKGVAKELGKANREIGAEVISRATPTPLAVGAGAGAKPRAVGSRNMVAISAGGGHRKLKVQQWGPRFVNRSSPRPYLVGALIDTMPDIERRYLGAIETAVKSAGLA
jgi:hypothetical protein